MESETHVNENDIADRLDSLGFKMNIAEGRLMLMELLAKANAGYYNSHTEERFLLSFKLTKSDRTANKKGRQFLCSMVYTHSNIRPECFNLMREYRA